MPTRCLEVHISSYCIIHFVHHTIIVLYNVYSIISSHSDTLIPVITVQLGEPATLTCALSHDELSSKRLYWYKQSAGDTLKLFVQLYKSKTPQYVFSSTRLDVQTDENFSNLTILSTTEEDEGMYHCAIKEWNNLEWSGTYLLVKGDNVIYFTLTLKCY